MKQPRAMMDRRSFELPSWLILIAAACLAVGIWWMWLTSGVHYVHTKVLKHATSISAPSPTVGTSTQNVSQSSTVDRAGAFSELGQAGDSFGAINALFAALAGAAVLWAGVLQGRALREARQAYKDERAANKREQFISTFFQMLTLNRQLVERIEVSPESKSSRVKPRMGAAALDSLAKTLVNRVEGNYGEEWKEAHKASVLVTSYLGHVYDQYPSSLGPYFRLLFQTFDFVAKATELDDAERIRFANIARGQISEGAVMLLAVNGLTERGHRFIPLIEQFGLLEHLHNDYRRKFKRVLLSGYRPRAFMGSDDRKATRLFPQPLHPAHFFTTWPDAME